jgi:hypothetical protein
MKLTPLEGELENFFCVMLEKWRNSNDGH